MWNDKSTMDVITIQGAFARAREALRVALRFHSEGLYEDTVLWSYTAVVHAARATLLVHERRVTTHAQLRRAFAAQLVRTGGRIATEHLHALMRVQDCRINLDLNAHGPLLLTVAQASPVVSDAARFLACMQRYLHHNGIEVGPSDPHMQCGDNSDSCVARPGSETLVV